MKNLKCYLLFLPALFFLQSATSSGPEAAAAKLKYPKKVNAIIQEKCYGCHSPEGKGDKAKQKLMWDDLLQLNASEQSEKLQNIIKVLDEGKMPPARFLEKMPEKKLTEAETAKMKKWAEKSLKKVSR